jgi:hypothetical protein
MELLGLCTSALSECKCLREPSCDGRWASTLRECGNLVPPGDPCP